MDKDNVEKLNHAVYMLFFALIPLMACFIMCLRDGIYFNEIFIANSKWNDEIFYYKMVEALANYGQPLGYFGYNESIANIGRLGPWSPVLFIFYIIYAKIFKWSMLSPVYCNLLLMTVAMIIFALLVRPTRKQTLLICLFSCLGSIYTRYIFSNMPEVSIYALLIIYLGIFIRIYRQKGKEPKVCYLVGLNIISSILTLMRPYWVLLVILLGYYWYRAYRKRKIFIAEGIWSLGCMAVYFFISKNLCAPYYTDIIKFDWIELLFSHPMQGIYNIMHIFISSVWIILQKIGVGGGNDSTVGGIYLLYLMAMIYFVYNIKQSSDDRNKKVIWKSLLFCFCAMLLAIIYLYDINVGSRHATGFVLIAVFIFSFEEKISKLFVIFLISFLWIFCIKATDEYTYQIPVYTEEKAMALQKGTDELEEADFIDWESGNPWDNTIIWLLNDETMVDFTYLYAMPAGVGIELCFKEYVLNNFSDLKPRYILTNIGEEIDLICEKKICEKVAEYGNVHIWRLR